MNNAKIAFDNVEPAELDRTSVLEKQRGEFAQLAEAVSSVEASQDWQKLKRLLFDGLVSTLERQLNNEASKDKVNETELYRLQGQLAWARKYADLKKLADVFKKQIENINNQINGNKNPGDGAP